MPTVNRFKTIAILALLAVWLGASNHCRLEQIPGLNLISCCEQDEGSPSPDKGCQTDGCAAVEDGLYKSSDRQSANLPPLLVLAPLLAPALVEPLESTPTRFGVATFPPPELPVTWQFCSRAAAPPRAPSPSIIS